MYKKELFNKVKAAVIGFFCVASLTACTLNVSDVKDKIDEKSVGVLSEMVDKTDISKKEEAKALASDMNEWCVVNGVSFQSARLVRIVDGDTIVVDIEGEETKVRLIGVNTPESVASTEYLEKTGKENTTEGKEASDFTKEVLAHVEKVYLQTDTNNEDKYGRLLRYVWIELPDGDVNVSEIKDKMLNGMLLAEGMAELEIYHPDDLYQDEFTKINEGKDR